MEDDLKIFKVEYLRNQGLDLTQIWDLCLDYQTKLYKCFKLRQPQIEEDLKILKLRIAANHWLDLTQTWNLISDGKTKFTNPWLRLQIKIKANAGFRVSEKPFVKEFNIFHRGDSEETLE